MVTKEITSLQHPFIKRALSLRIDKEEREKEKRVLVIGKKLVSDLSRHYPLEILFYVGEIPSLRSLEKIRVSSAVYKKITGIDEETGLAAIVEMPSEQSLKQKDHILILDEVGDPGNLGTLFRTALALGWDGIWLTPGCVDPFNDKALRAAQGATFQLPFERVFSETILSWVKSKKASLFVADLGGTLLDQLEIQKPLALVLGNEGHGPSAFTQSIGQKITIPISKIESLNVASAGAILLYALRPEK